MATLSILSGRRMSCRGRSIKADRRRTHQIRRGEALSHRNAAFGMRLAPGTIGGIAAEPRPANPSGDASRSPGCFIPLIGALPGLVYRDGLSGPFVGPPQVLDGRNLLY